MTEFAKYEGLKLSGASTETAYQVAKRSGMGDIEAIRMLRAVYGLSLRRAKEAMLVGSGVARSLDEHEASLAKELRDNLHDE